MVPAIITVFCWCIGIYLLWRIPVCSGTRIKSEQCGCSIVVPARNEAANLPRLLATLTQQLGPSDEIVVIDDQSTDATPAIAREHGARVIHSRERPDGWTGKTWACWQGAQASRNEVLLFVDADTWFAPTAVGRMVATLQRRGGLVSVLPYHRMYKPHERLSALFNLMIAMGVDAFTLRGVNRKPSGSFGPCILCSKHDYFAVGGHARVRGLVLENLNLGRLFQEAGLGIRCYGGAGTLFVRMYPRGVRELIDGWSKGLASGASHTRPPTMALILAWISGAFAAAILTGVAIGARDRREGAAALSSYALYGGQLFWMLRRIGNYGIITCLLFPLHLLFFTLVYLHSFVVVSIRRKVRWKGRAVTVPK